MAETAALRALIADVVSELPEPTPARPAPAPPIPAPIWPRWQAWERTGGTYTPGTDWRPQFESTTVTYTEYDLPTVSGHLAMSFSSTRPSRARIAFESPEPRTVSGYLVADNWGRIQLVVNETRAEYTADSTVTISLRRGLNVIDVMSEGTADRIELRAPFPARRA